MNQPSSMSPYRLFAGAAVPVLLMASPPLGQGQATPAGNTATNAPVTLAALVTEALERNPELKFYDLELAAAKAGRRTAGLWADPEAAGGVGQKRVTGDGPAAEGVAWSVALLQPFDWPGRIGLRKAIANREIELAQLGYERFKLALAGRVRTLAHGLFAAQERSAAAAEVAARFKDLREVLVQRDPAGLTPLLETRVIEATELTAQRRASEAQLAAQSAMLELNQLRGVPPGTRLSVRPPRLAFRPSEDVGLLVGLARTNNFELRVRAIELAQQGFRVDLARNERYPSIRIGPTISEEHAGSERERIIGLGVSLPLPLWNRNQGSIEIAEVRQAQAAVSFHVTERELAREVMAAALAYETRRREMATWRPDAVRHFREAAEVADRHYRLGAVPIGIYVELQRQYLEAVASLLDTSQETLDAALRLELLTGLTSPLVHVMEEQP